MDLRSLVDALRIRWKLALAVALVSLLAALTYSFLQKPEYEASATAYVSTRAADNASDLSQGSDYSARLVQGFAEVASSTYIARPVAADLRIRMKPEDLAKRVSAEAKLNTSVLKVTVTYPTPATAAKIANAVLQELSARAASLSPRTDGATSPVKVTPINLAVAPERPASPNRLLNALLGLAVGVLLAMFLAVALQRLDTRLRDPDALAQVTRAPLLGRTFYDTGVGNHPLFLDSQPGGINSEQVRSVRNNLQFALAARGGSVVTITSAMPSEGKSVLTSNLALAVAQAGRSVLLVDGDMRRPSIHRYFGLIEQPGLSDVLAQNALLEDAVQRVGIPDLQILPAGTVPPNPNELLQSPRMEELLQRVSEEYDLIIIDSPPLGPVSDAAVLAKLSAGAILVAGMRSVKRPQLVAATASLERTGATVLGVVASMVKVGRRAASTYAY